MRSTNDGTSKGSLAEGTPQSGGLLSPDELALPAICGQTGKAFLMVGRRQGRWVLELIRAVAIAPVPSVTGMPVFALRRLPAQPGISAAGADASWILPGLSVACAAGSCYLSRKPLLRPVAVRVEECQRTRPCPSRHSPCAPGSISAGSTLVVRIAVRGGISIATTVSCPPAGTATTGGHTSITPMFGAQPASCGNAR
jgi:hypothetical protein